jgi:threonine dehydratase
MGGERNSTTPVEFSDIETAMQRLDGSAVAKQTPVDRSTSLEEMTGAVEVLLKMEHLQWTGSFKTRGAYNKISESLEAGEIENVVAASAGNHAQGVAVAATERGIDATIIMPRTAPETKVNATRGYGATVELVGQDFQAARRHAEAIAAETEATLIHPYDDPAIVAGQGTLGVEMCEDAPDLDTIVVPIGGGGLISGIAIAFAELSPETRIVGVQAEGAATVAESLDKGVPVTLDSVDTIADGIATGGVSELTLSIIEEHVDKLVTVSNTEIADATLVLMERAKQVVEGAASASVAAIRSDDLDVTDEQVMPLLCGGNLDITMLRAVLIHALTARKQLVRFRVHTDDKPGNMAEITKIIADHGANIQAVRHDRALEDLGVGEVSLVFEIETSGINHAELVTEAIADSGYDVEVTNRASAPPSS